ncbi:MAG TPA: YaeQ family protein [Burkholderiaceae bacterium]|nr:YaeQ family protein [Burkholderiaceae bacterium]
MALRATVYKVDLQVSDIDRACFGTFPLSLARHPSETEERLMVRLLAFALHADEGLGFGRGISTEDEPALWRRDLTGAITSWIEVGLPDERVLKRAAGRSEEVVVYTYGGRTARQWWQQNAASLNRLRNLRVVDLPPELTTALADRAKRNMAVDVTVQEGEMWISIGDDTLHARPDVLQATPT